jgi:hypothetical protein
VEVRPWVDAVALDPDRIPDEAVISEPADRIAYQDLRSRVLLTPEATVSAVGMADGVTLQVDGRNVPRGRVPPGFHRVVLLGTDGTILLRRSVELAPGQDLAVVPGASPGDISRFARQARSGPERLPVPSAVASTLATLEAPVELFVGTRDQVLRYRVEQGIAMRVGEGSSSEASGLRVRVGVGGGWIYDGEYYLQNAADDAPHARSTVNSPSAVMTVGASQQAGGVLLGVGLDGYLPTGEHHTLPVGETEIRLRGYPHLAAGLALPGNGGSVSWSAGPLFPWSVGTGPRLTMPMGRLVLEASLVYSRGLTMTRSDETEFDATDGLVSWATVQVPLNL